MGSYRSGPEKPQQGRDHPGGDAYAETNPYSRAFGGAYACCDADAPPDADPNAHAYSDADAYPHADPNAHAYPVYDDGAACGIGKY